MANDRSHQGRLPLPLGVCFVAAYYVFEDANSALSKLQQFAELLAEHCAAYAGIAVEERDSSLDVIRSLRNGRVLEPQVTPSWFRSHADYLTARVSRICPESQVELAWKSVECCDRQHGSLPDLRRRRDCCRLAHRSTVTACPGFDRDQQNYFNRRSVTGQLNQFVSLKPMNQSQPKNPLHGITLKSILEYLVAEYGWERLGDRINIRCFTSEPSINSSLKFLRKTDWARAKVERLYLYSISYDARHGKRDADANERQSETGSVWDRARQN